MIEHIIGYHCGPALAGIKPANLVAFQKGQFSNIFSEINRLNKELNGRDIFLEILCECDKRVLVMVYRSKILNQCLQDPERRDFLYRLGYPADIFCQLKHLKEKLENKGFPHEIGAFLGYPMQDIYGFLSKKEEECLLTGEWKVYHNQESAKKMFCRYQACRKGILKRLMEGKTLAQLFCAA